jgi:hypothetical protein
VADGRQIAILLSDHFDNGRQHGQNEPDNCA